MHTSKNVYLNICFSLAILIICIHNSWLSNISSQVKHVLLPIYVFYSKSSNCDFLKIIFFCPNLTNVYSYIFLFVLWSFNFFEIDNIVSPSFNIFRTPFTFGIIFHTDHCNFYIYEINNDKYISSWIETVCTKLLQIFLRQILKAESHMT